MMGNKSCIKRTIVRETSNKINVKGWNVKIGDHQFRRNFGKWHTISTNPNPTNGWEAWGQ